MDLHCSPRNKTGAAMFAGWITLIALFSVAYWLTRLKTAMTF
jgi:hypothetical protein